MIIICPSCSGRFYYDENRFQGRATKRLGCPNCVHEFEILNPHQPAPLVPSGLDPLGFNRYVVLTVSGVAMDPYVIQQALVLIGRSEGEIITHDPQCSRRHAQICLEHDGSVWLEDLGSTNGTLLKGKVIKERSRLENNSEFTCGQTRFQLMIHPIARNRKST